MLTWLAQNTLPIGQTAQDLGLPGSANYNPDKPGNSFSFFLSGILQAILVIGALLVLIGLVTGAIEWITGGGDKAKIEKARNRITQSVIGLVVLSATTAIFMLIQSFLGVELIRFNSIIQSTGTSRGTQTIQYGTGRTVNTAPTVPGTTGQTGIDPNRR